MGSFLVMTRGTPEKVFEWFKAAVNFKIPTSLGKVTGCKCDDVKLTMSPIVRPVQFFDISMGDSGMDIFAEGFLDEYNVRPPFPLPSFIYKILPRFIKYRGKEVKAPDINQGGKHENLAVSVLGERIDNNHAQITGHCDRCGYNRTEVYG